MFWLEYNRLSLADCADFVCLLWVVRLCLTLPHTHTLSWCIIQLDCYWSIQILIFWDKLEKNLYLTILYNLLVDLAIVSNPSPQHFSHNIPYWRCSIRWLSQKFGLSQIIPQKSYGALSIQYVTTALPSLPCAGELSVGEPSLPGLCS